MQNKHQSDAPDPDNMLGHVLAWPKLLELGWEAGGLPSEQQASLKAKRQIVCCGMGGSAIGAGIVGDYLVDQLTVPYLVVRDYDLPPFVDEDTLVLCLSYSGGTEETLSAYAQAKQRGAAVLAVATGGTLLTQAATDDVPALRFEYPGQPRVSLPIMVGLLLRLFGELGYVSDQSAAVNAAGATLASLAQTSERDPSAAEALAAELAGMVPIVYGAGFLAEAARRLKGEANENSKQTAGWEVLPEQNHNALVGYEFPADMPAHVRFVLLRS
ncbi:MAG: SIS domain-containing protein [Hymenobacter sp.]